MLDCWLENPASRPTFTQLKAKFDTMLLANNQYIQFDGINIHEPYYNNTDTDASSGRRSTEDESSIMPVNISTSEFESSSDSSIRDTDTSCKASTLSLVSLTLNNESASSSSSYDVLRPKLTEVCIIPESSSQPIPNPYVDTPTKLPDGCAFDLDNIQQTIHEDTELVSPEHIVLEVSDTTLYTL